MPVNRLEESPLPDEYADSSASFHHPIAVPTEVHVSISLRANGLDDALAATFAPRCWRLASTCRHRALQFSVE